MMWTSHHTDAELLAGLKDRDPAAFREIYTRYVHKLFYYAHARIHNREDCRELVQETFESLWKTETNVRELAPFLFTILKFKIITFYEHRNVQQKCSEYLARFATETDTEPDEPELETLREAINRSLATLPQRCQDAVRLRIDEELSLDEIAHRMNVTKGSVKRYLTLAMNSLREQHRMIYKSTGQ